MLADRGGRSASCSSAATAKTKSRPSRGGSAPPAPPAPADGAIALVHQRPLPYLYLARQVLGAYDVSWQAVDALPLAAEPWAAAVDVVLTFAASDASRAAGVALLSTPLLRFDVRCRRRRRSMRDAADRVDGR